jgi:hypothetical protein
MLDLLILNWQAVTFFIYTFVGVMLCHGIQKWVSEEKDQQRNAEEKMHFIVMSFLVIFVLMRFVLLFCGRVLLHPATMGGVFCNDILLVLCNLSV